MMGMVDYVVFGVSLVIPIIIALYFACIKKQRSISDFLIGNRSLSSVPMSFSLCTTYLSSLLLTGACEWLNVTLVENWLLFLHFIPDVPAQIAYFGWLFPITWLVATTISALIFGNLFIPILYKMKLTSAYEVINPHPKIFPLPMMNFEQELFMVKHFLHSFYFSTPKFPCFKMAVIGYVIHQGMVILPLCKALKKQ